MFSPQRAAACPVTADPRHGIAAIAPRMPESSRGLISAMIRRRAAHSRRHHQGSLRRNASQKPDRLIQRPRAFLRPDSRASGQSHDVTAHPAAQLLDEGRIKGRILAGEIHLANHGADARRLRVFLPEPRLALDEQKRRQKIRTRRETRIIEIISKCGASPVSASLEPALMGNVPCRRRSS